MEWFLGTLSKECLYDMTGKDTLDGIDQEANMKWRTYDKFINFSSIYTGSCMWKNKPTKKIK